MIHLYAAVDDPVAACAVLGPAAEVLHHGTVACVGTEVASEALVPTEPALRRHLAAVEDLLGVCTVVPFRFGTAVDDEEDLRRRAPELAARAPELLSWFRGRVELGVRAYPEVPDPTLPPPPRSGREYLRALRDRSVPSTQLRALHTTLAGAAAATTVSMHGVGLTAAYLVAREDLESFRLLAQRAGERLPSPWQMSVTGPWAPYSFVDAPPRDAGSGSPLISVGGGR